MADGDTLHLPSPRPEELYLKVGDWCDKVKKMEMQEKRKRMVGNGH